MFDVLYILYYLENHFQVNLKTTKMTLVETERSILGEIGPAQIYSNYILRLNIMN